MLPSKQVHLPTAVLLPVPVFAGCGPGWWLSLVALQLSCSGMWVWDVGIWMVSWEKRRCKQDYTLSSERLIVMAGCHRMKTQLLPPSSMGEPSTRAGIFLLEP